MSESWRVVRLKVTPYVDCYVAFPNTIASASCADYRECFVSRESAKRGQQSDKKPKLPDFQNEIAPLSVGFALHFPVFHNFCQISPLKLVRVTYNQLCHIEIINFDIPHQTNDVIYNDELTHREDFFNLAN